MFEESSRIFKCQVKDKMPTKKLKKTQFFSENFIVKKLQAKSDLLAKDVTVTVMIDRS